MSAAERAPGALARGGVETRRGHYPLMVLLHTGLLVGCVVEVWSPTGRSCPGSAGRCSALVLAAQALRWWCIATLGHAVEHPGHRRAAGCRWSPAGPYRWLRHPNYVAVVVEGVALPLVHTAWVTALVFTVLNACAARASGSASRTPRCARAAPRRA